MSQDTPVNPTAPVVPAPPMFKDEWEAMQALIDSVGSKIQEDAAVSPHVRRAAANYLFLMELASNYLLGTLHPCVTHMGKAALDAAGTKQVKDGTIQFPKGK
jgi:hypothetical protein